MLLSEEIAQLCTIRISNLLHLSAKVKSTLAELENDLATASTDMEECFDSLNAINRQIEADIQNIPSYLEAIYEDRLKQLTEFVNSPPAQSVGLRQID